MIIQSIKVYNFTIFFGSSLIFSCHFSDPKIQKKKKGKKKDQTNHQKMLMNSIWALALSS